ncbi:hypothetical protein BLOT_015464 [Blomia tropicalis]|nr:hypothetical protein BLOT_015464 [Blomia tropicalis]
MKRMKETDFWLYAACSRIFDYKTLATKLNTIEIINFRVLNGNRFDDDDDEPIRLVLDEVSFQSIKPLLPIYFPICMCDGSIQ